MIRVTEQEFNNAKVIWAHIWDNRALGITDKSECPCCLLVKQSLEIPASYVFPWYAVCSKACPVNYDYLKSKVGATRHCMSIGSRFMKYNGHSGRRLRICAKIIRRKTVWYDYEDWLERLKTLTFDDYNDLADITVPEEQEEI